MQAVKTTKQAKAVTEEKIITHESVNKPSILSKIKSTLKTILFGDPNDISPDSEKIRNYNNYKNAKSAELARSVKLQTFIR